MASIADQLRAAVAPNTTLPAGPGEALAALAPASPAPATPNTTQPPPAPAQPHSCGFCTYWLDPNGNWRCESCSPPKFAFMVRRRITIGPAGQTSEISAADENRYEKFLEIKGGDGRIHLVHRDVLDPHSDYYDHEIAKKISLGVENSDREFFSIHEILSGVLAEHGSINRLPGPWPREEINFSALPDENANLPKNKNSRGRKPAARSRKR